MASVKIWIHAVWGVKDRRPLLTNDIRTVLFRHIKENAAEKKMYIDFINGWIDHVHILMTLNADMSIAKAIQLIKGESAHWANVTGLMRTKLEWADEYFAASVSESLVENIRAYIRTQEEHHRSKTFAEEYEQFLRLHKVGHG